MAVRLLVCGGKDYELRPFDWLRLDAIHLTRPSDPEAQIGALVAAAGGGPRQGDLLSRPPTGPVEVLYHGDARGADRSAGRWAMSRGIPVLPFPADWSAHGDAAGPIRNSDMAAGRHPDGPVPPPDLCAAFKGGDGTADMVKKARAAGTPVVDYRGGPAQRWTADDIKHLSAGGGLEAPDLPDRALALWLVHGGGGIPVVSGHLLRQAGKFTFPKGWIYIGRACYGLPGSPLGNPYVPVAGEDPEVCLGKFRAHLRGLVAQRGNGVRELLERMGPQTPLVCWCHASKPCHGEVVADAALQLGALAAMRLAGLPTPPPTA